MTTAPENNLDPERVARLFGVPPELLGTEASPEIRTQDQFLTALDELLDNTLHDDACYIEPNNTTCVCILGRIRADLPPCGAYRERPVLGERDASYWRCLRSAHPASPDRHVFSEN